jgi:hypothetical protein
MKKNKIMDEESSIHYFIIILLKKLTHPQGWDASGRISKFVLQIVMNDSKVLRYAILSVFLLSLYSAEGFQSSTLQIRRRYVAFPVAGCSLYYIFNMPS